MGTTKCLNARERLKAVMDRLDELKKNFNVATVKKENWLQRVFRFAEKLLGGLEGEEVIIDEDDALIALVRAGNVAIFPPFLQSSSS